MKKRSAIAAIDALSDNDVRQMYNLMASYYDNLKFDKFHKDLYEKNFVVMLRDQKGIYGFSTIEHMPLTVDGIDILGVFSGDTIVAQNRPLGLGLQQLFCRHIDALMAVEEKPLYWFLICKGYLTYKYMSMYFEQYSPMIGAEISVFDKKIMDSYATLKYADAYDPITGIIRNSGANDYLKEGVASIDQRIRMNPVVAFFEERNPCHRYGDELVCLARFSKENLNNTFYRMVRRG